jgi:hypothetical protein
MALACAQAASGQVQQKRQDFSAAPGWLSFNSVRAPQRFGWVPEGHLAGGAGRGEAGGVFCFQPKAFYADDVGELRPGQGALSAAGVFRLTDPGTPGNIFVGWFEAGYDAWPARTGAIGFHAKKGGVWLFVSNGTAAYHEVEAVPEGILVDVPFRWRLSFDPQAAGGLGVAALAVEGRGEASVALRAGYKDTFIPLTRFGLAALYVHGAESNRRATGYLDDVEYTAGSPGPASPDEKMGVQVAAVPSPAAGAALTPAEPIAVGSDKQLLVDERFFDTSDGIRLTLHQPVKDPTPLLTASRDNPWERNRITGGSLIEVDGQVWLYYDAIAPSGFNQRQRYLCLARSADGLHFEKPRLGVCEFAGSTENNIVFPPRWLPHEPCNVFLDGNPACPPEQRFKLMTNVIPNHPGGDYDWRNADTYFATSPDGIHFTLLDRPSHGMCDGVNRALWDPYIGHYVAYMRAGNAFGRAISRCEFDELTAFGEEHLVFGADEIDQQHLDPELFTGMDFYTSLAQFYQGAPRLYLYFPMAYYHYPADQARRRGRGGTRNPSNDGPLEAHFAVSRDGIRITRPERRAFIPRGVDGAWDWGTTYMIGHVIRGDAIWLYYGGAPFTHGDYRLDEAEALGGIGRALLRLDGFVSAEAGSEPGGFVTPPLVFAGKALELNLETAAGGWARMALLEADGRPLPGYTLDECFAVNGNYVRCRVRWGGTTDVGSLAGRPVRLQVRQRLAHLYAFQFVP